MAKTKKAVSINQWIKEQLADKGLWHTIIGAFIGGFLAIFAGLAVYSFQTMHQHTLELKIKTEQKQILLEGLKKSLEDNIKTMEGIIDPKSGGIVINNVNLSYFQSTSQLKYQTLDNTKLAEEIDDLTFRLNSLEQAVKNFQNIYFNPLSASGSNFMNTRGKELRLNIVLATRQTIVIAGLVLKDVDAALDKLDKIAGNAPAP